MAAELVQFPERASADVVSGLRDLADQIEAGEYDEARTLVWVCDCGNGRLEVGHIGFAPEPAATAYLLLGRAMTRIEGL